jgi:diguanylate cyclase (GGDEF)-like protein
MEEKTNPNPAALDIQEVSLFQHCPDYFLIVDPDWTILHANPSFHERFTPSRPAQGTSLLAYLDTPSGMRAHEMALQSNPGSREVDLNHLAPDSRTVTVHYSFFPLSQTIDGQPLWAAIGRDRAGDLATLLEIIQLNMELERSKRELSEANARLELQAMTDQITQLYNRHYFFQVAQHFWEESRRYKIPLTLMMMDLDDFKAVNDTYGHLFGDHVLASSASRLKGNTRRSDILARYGGEEIVLLASNTDLATGLVLAERLRLAVCSEPFVMGTCVATVTISIGISGTELCEFADFAELLDSSDQALYRAKHAGKNCVFQYEKGPARN